MRAGPPRARAAACARPPAGAARGARREGREGGEEGGSRRGGQARALVARGPHGRRRAGRRELLLAAASLAARVVHDVDKVNPLDVL